MALGRTQPLACGVPFVSPRRLAMPALSFVVACMSLVGTFAAARVQPERTKPDVWAVVLIVVAAALLARVHRQPVPVLVAQVPIALTLLLVGYPYGPGLLPLVVTLVAAVLQGHRAAAWAAGVSVYGLHVAGRTVWGDDPPTVVQLLSVPAWLVAMLVVAEATRARADSARAARRERELEARRLASEERVRIARELHDVIAHHMSLINVQAGVALHLGDDLPRSTRDSLATIKTSSKEALVEMRAIIDVLRGVDDAGPRQPAPGLARLTDLTARVQEAGVDVVTEVDGVPATLSSTVDLAAYRIAQEALTNVVRHARARRVVVTLHYAPQHLDISIVDDGVGSDTGLAGRGLTGMRERAVSLHGQFAAGNLPTRGYRVSARLPLGAEQ